MHRLLAHPRTRGVDLDDPRTAMLRRDVVSGKGFLRRLYGEWYRKLGSRLPEDPRPALELGCGGGFMDQVVPGLIRSELWALPGVDLAVDARRLCVAPGSLRGVLMVNVLHHVPDPVRFLAEASRSVMPGGVIAMVEPWVSAWSRLVYRHLHHEPFDPGRQEWWFPSTGPVSGANGALPWILFERDRDRLERELPELRVELIRPETPLRYLLSGGVGLRGLMPGWSFGAWTGLERLLEPLMGHLAMFALIVLRCEPVPSEVGGER